MKTIVLTHCYSDENRGDAGIIDATCRLFKDVAGKEGVCIKGISTFHFRDVRYRDHHSFTRNSLDGVIPSLFPEPFIKESEIEAPSTFYKSINFCNYLIKSLLLCLVPSRHVARLLYSKPEYQTFQEIMKADAIVSKGGSFLYSFKGISGDLFLIRMLIQLVIPIRFGKPVFIFCQSVGPFENRVSRFLFNWVVSRVEGCYLRETDCLKFFNKFGFDKSKIIIATDAAFYYSKIFDRKNSSLSGLNKIGITARPHSFSKTEGKDSYINALVGYVTWVVKSKKAKVSLIPQVIGPSKQEDDRVVLGEIYGRLSDDVKAEVERVPDNLSPMKLIEVYKGLDVLVGTRLHSVIFALCTGTEVINIAYHGTKSQGILGDIGLGSRVLSIETISVERLIEATDAIANKRIPTDKLLSSKVSILECAARQILK